MNVTRALIGIGGALAAGGVSACSSTPKQSPALGAEPLHQLAAGTAVPAQGLVASPRSVAVLSGTDPSRDSPLGYHLELTASGHNGDAGSGPRAGLASMWHDRLDLDGRLNYGDLVSLEVQGTFFDIRAPAEDDGFPLMSGELSGWEENRVGDATVVLGLLDDRLRLTSRRASSRYGLVGSYSERPTTNDKRRDDDEGRQRFLNEADGEGAAVLHRLDAEIWRSSDLSVSVFGLYNEVDRYFESVDLADDDPFATSNRKTLEAGTTLGLGPVEVTLSRGLTQKIDEADAPEEAQYAATVGLDLNDLRSRIGDGLSGGLWWLAPSAAWVSVAQGTVKENGGRRRPEDRTGDLSFGLSWDWAGPYASLDFWRSRYDYRQPGAEDYDWVGSGADAAFGFGGERWNADASLGFYRSTSEEATSRSIDVGYDGTISLSYRPERRLPDLSADLYLGRYETDYTYGLSRTDVWEVGATLDFSKYLVDWLPGIDEPGLKLMYRFEGLSTGDSSAGADRETDHRVAILWQFMF